MVVSTTEAWENGRMGEWGNGGMRECVKSIYMLVSMYMYMSNKHGSRS